MVTPQKTKTTVNPDRKTAILQWSFIITLVSFLLGCVFLFFVQPQRLFSDFAEVLCYCLVKNPYDGSMGIAAIYPPISYLMFAPFLIFCRDDIQAMVDGRVDLYGIHTRPMFVLAYIIYFLFTLALILLLIAKMTKLKGKNLFYLIGIIVLSGPTYYAFTRGNIIITACLFTLIFFWWYQSEKRWQRELASVCLALAVAIKIYPAVIVLVLLKDRRWLDMIKTGLYAMVLTFLPFIFVSGNIFENIQCILQNYENLVDKQSAFPLISLVGVANVVSYFFNLYFGSNFGQVLPVIAGILKYTLAMVSLVTILLCHRSEKKFEIATVAIGCYSLFQNVSYAYVFVFTFILFALFLNTIETYRKSDVILYGVIFVVIYFAAPYIFKFCLIQFFAMLVLTVKALVDLLIEYVKSRKNKPIVAGELAELNQQ